MWGIEKFVIEGVIHSDQQAGAGQDGYSVPLLCSKRVQRRRKHRENDSACLDPQNPQQSGVSQFIRNCILTSQLTVE